MGSARQGYKSSRRGRREGRLAASHAVPQNLRLRDGEAIDASSSCERMHTLGVGWCAPCTPPLLTHIMPVVCRHRSGSAPTCLRSRAAQRAPSGGAAAGSTGDHPLLRPAPMSADQDHSPALPLLNSSRPCHTTLLLPRRHSPRREVLGRLSGHLSPHLSPRVGHSSSLIATEFCFH